MDEFQQRGGGVGALCLETAHLHIKTNLNSTESRDKVKKYSVRIHKSFSNTYLRPDRCLKHSINLIRPEAVGVKAIEEVQDPQDPESPQVLQRINTACSQLREQI